MVRQKHLALLFILLLTFPMTDFACSAFKFVQDGKVYVGKNFDWHSGVGYLIKNNRGINKYAYQAFEGKPAQWTSKYGSVTFNQIGKEFPYGGINEQGLVVEQLWLGDAQYADASIDKVSELEWIQYQLDNYATVDEVLAASKRLSVDPVFAKVHYFIIDKEGNSAVIEFVKGELVISRNAEDIQVITNSLSESSVKFYNKNAENIQSIKTDSRHSLHRYCFVNHGLNEIKSKRYFTEKNAFQILDRVFESGESYKTQWSIVYNISDMTIQFRTFENRDIKTIDLKGINFGEEAPITYFDLENKNSANINDDFAKYSAAINKKLMIGSMKPLKLSFDYEQLNSHQINPNMRRKDTSFINNHFDLTIEFRIKKAKGLLKYFVSNSEESFKRWTPNLGGFLFVKENLHQEIHYSVAKGAYALGSYQDLNNNGRLDFNFMKMPKEPMAFSNNKKRFFFAPPSYKQAMFEVRENTTIVIKLK